MDHHCPWVNNCVAFNNYKFFVLFLMYGLLYCLYVALTSLKYFLQVPLSTHMYVHISQYSYYCIPINAPEFSQPLLSRYLIKMLQFWRDVGAGQGHGQFHILFLFFVSSMFSISLCSLLGYHIHLVLNNRTTLEAFRW